MFRNESTGRFESTKTKDEQIEELKAKLAVLEEEKAKEAQAEQEAAKNTKKEEAMVVKTAISESIEAEDAARKTRAEADRTYLEAVAAAQKTRQEAYDAAEANVTAKRDAKYKALKDWCKKYGAFHDSITVGDVTYNCDYDTNKVSWVNPFKPLLDKPLLDFWF